ncbi:MAG: hypothetical protein A4E72_01539 [Syntrophus sp. PtaU1.Bin208]|nr:MAG: hypothetical protein A4E72_01539 [Syntrophus sp. PtaU1.Bin208]
MVVGAVAQGAEKLGVGFGAAGVVLVKNVDIVIRVCCPHEIDAQDLAQVVEGIINQRATRGSQAIRIRARARDVFESRGVVVKRAVVSRDNLVSHIERAVMGICRVPVTLLKIAGDPVDGIIRQGRKLFVVLLAGRRIAGPLIVRNTTRRVERVF